MSLRGRGGVGLVAAWRWAPDAVCCLLSALRPRFLGGRDHILLGVSLLEAGSEFAFHVQCIARLGYPAFATTRLAVSIAQARGCPVANLSMARGILVGLKL